MVVTRRPGVVFALAAVLVATWTIEFGVFVHDFGEDGSARRLEEFTM